MADYSEYQLLLRQDAVSLRYANDPSPLLRDSAATLLYLAAENYQLAGFSEGVAICTAALFASESPRAALYLQRLTTYPEVTLNASRQVTRMSSALLGHPSLLANLDPGTLPDLFEPGYRNAFPSLLPALAANALDGARPADVARKCHAAAINLLASLERDGLGADVATSLLANPFQRQTQVLALSIDPPQAKILQGLNDATRAIFTTLSTPEAATPEAEV